MHDIKRCGLEKSLTLIFILQMGTGAKPESDRAANQDLVPESEDEEQKEHAEAVSKPGGQLQLRVRGWRSLSVSGAAASSLSASS